MSSELETALLATGPNPEHEDKLMLFGQFVGEWEIKGTFFDRDGSVVSEHAGEWIWGWVLDGRAIQDVIISPPRSRSASGRPFEYGSSVRFFDPRLDGWRVLWVSPVSGAVVQLVAREQDEGIVLEGRTPKNDRCRWTFTDIERDSVVWSGYESNDEGRTWFRNEQMLLTRRSPGSGSSR